MPSTDSFAPNLFDHPSPTDFICLNITEPIEDLFGSALDISRHIVGPHVPCGRQGSCTGHYVPRVILALTHTREPAGMQSKISFLVTIPNIDIP